MRGSGGCLYAIRRRTVVRNRLLAISPLSCCSWIESKTEPSGNEVCLHFKLLKLLAQKEATPVSLNQRSLVRRLWHADGTVTPILSSGRNFTPGLSRCRRSVNP